MNEKIDEDVKTTIHTCPMHPEVRQEGPGKCPECGMFLVPEGGADEHDHSGATGAAGGCCGGKGHGDGGGCCGGKGHDQPSNQRKTKNER